MRRLVNGAALTGPQLRTCLCPRTSPSPRLKVCLCRQSLSPVMDVGSLHWVSYEPQFHRSLLNIILFPRRPALSPPFMLPNPHPMCSLHTIPTLKSQSRAMIWAGNLKISPSSPRLSQSHINYQRCTVLCSLFGCRDIHHARLVLPPRIHNTPPGYISRSFIVSSRWLEMQCLPEGKGVRLKMAG